MNQLPSHQTITRIRNYSLIVTILLAVVFITSTLKQPANLIAVKLLVVPLAFLAFPGLKSLYAQPIVKDRFTTSSVEFFILEGLLLVLFLVVIMWSPDISVSRLLVMTTTGLLIAIPIKLLSLWLKIKDHQQH